MIDLYFTKLDTKLYLETVQKKLNYYENKNNYYNNLIISKKSKKNIIEKKLNNDKYLNKYQKDLIEATKLLHKYPDGIITSCALIVKQKNETTILIDGFNNEYKKFNSKHLLIWQLIENYKNQGFNKLNLGGVSNIATDKDKYIGLNEFKVYNSLKVKDNEHIKNDPFDKILLAQAMSENMILITHDKKFKAYSNSNILLV